MSGTIRLPGFSCTSTASFELRSTLKKWGEMKKLVIIQLVVVLLIGAMFTAGCGEKGESPVAELPTFEIGNAWEYRWVTGGGEYTLTTGVIDEGVVDGKEYWGTLSSISPDLPDLQGSLTSKIDKSTHLQLEEETQYTTHSEVLSSSYEFPEGPYWPLEEGKEIKMIVSTTRTITIVDTGATDTVTETTTGIAKVEKVEEITVPAGTFTSFKVVHYDDYGKKLRTWWHSEEVKWDVKQIDNINGDILELKSYVV